MKGCEQWNPLCLKRFLPQQGSNPGPLDQQASGKVFKANAVDENP